MKTFGLAAFAGCLLVVLTAHGGDEAALKKERTALHGVWKIVSLETSKGKDTDVEGATLEFDKEGKNLTFKKGDETKKGTITLNPAGKPKEIDIAIDDKKLEGVYSIEKNTLKLCLCTDGGDGRPGEVALKDGKKYVLITLEKTK